MQFTGVGGQTSPPLLLQPPSNPPPPHDSIKHLLLFELLYELQLLQNAIFCCLHDLSKYNNKMYYS